MAGATDPAFRKWADAARSTPIGDVADGRGLRLRGTIERVGGCPICGDDGKRDADRFSVNTVKNVWACRKCEPRGGDVIELVRFLDQCDFLTACEVLTGIAPPSGKGAGIDHAALAILEAERVARRAEQAAQQDAYREAERERCWAMWLSAKPAAGTIVEDYLRLRRLTLPPGKALRFAPEARLYGERRKGERAPELHRGPAMYAAIRMPDGRFGGLHMTWIDLSDPDGKMRVADPLTGELTPAKKVRGSQRGGRIELTTTHDANRLVIGEGNETALSVRDDLAEAGEDLGGTVFWSAINMGNLGGPAVDNVAHPTLKTDAGRARKVPCGWPSDKGPAIPVPDSITDIVILGDGDSDPFTTRLACERASRRWARPGRSIRGAFAPAGMDFNDVRRGRK